MRPGDIVGVHSRLASHNRTEIEALDVERVARGYRLVVEDDRSETACRRGVRGRFLGTCENHLVCSGHEMILRSCFQALPALTPGARRNSVPKVHKFVIQPSKTDSADNHTAGT